MPTKKLNAKKNKRVPMPKWVAETTIKCERKNQATPKKQKNATTQRKQKINDSPKINIEFIEARCSCDGENENCFRCNGLGFYQSKIITNLEECRERVQEKLTHEKSAKQESNFSNDQRGGVYGVREHGRFSSNPLYEEDI